MHLKRGIAFSKDSSNFKIVTDTVLNKTPGTPHKRISIIENLFKNVIHNREVSSKLELS